MRVLSSLKHDNIIRLFDVIYVGNCIYFVMEYASGGSLVNYTWSRPEHRLPLPEAQELFRQMVGAVEYCHRRRIIHRDLKVGYKRCGGRSFCQGQGGTICPRS